MGYTTTYELCLVIRSHGVSGLKPWAARLANILGAIVQAYFGSLLQGKAGTMEEVPIPGSWHPCVTERAACLRGLDLARDLFVVAELDCRWAC